ncbi:MAG: hypothetical protein ACYTXA_18645 [Nostoc sp.]
MNFPVIAKPVTPKTSYVLLYNLSWDQLEKLDINLEGTSARLTYLDGILEIMSPLSENNPPNSCTDAINRVSPNSFTFRNKP